MSWNTYTSHNELITNARAANAVDISGTITTSGTTATLVFNGEKFFIGNPHATATLWIRWQSAPTANAAGAMPIFPGGAISTDDGAMGTMYMLSTTNSQPFTAFKWN